MSWQTIAIQRLRRYETQKLALSTIPEQLSVLDSEFEGLRSATLDGTPVTGTNSNTREQMLVGNIAKREELKRNYKIAKDDSDITEKALAVLSEQEQRILYLFYVRRPPGHIQLLCNELFVEKTKLYMMKDEALVKFTRACSGVVEL